MRVIIVCGGLPLKNQLKGGEGESRECPNCHTNRIWKDGMRKTKKKGVIQRYICAEKFCEHRFSESTALSMNQSNSASCQVGAVLTEAKNLTEIQPQKSGLAGATARIDINSKITDFVMKLRNDNYSKDTKKAYVKAIEKLVEYGADLLNPESVKETLAKQTYSDAYKHVIAAGYSLFLKMLGLTWTPPIWHINRKLPYIPTEKDLDVLIAGCGKKTSAFLQLLKETAFRAGEASRLKWEDVDFQRKLITMNNSEKNGNTGIYKVSNELISMLSALPRKNEYLFGTPSKTCRSSVYYKRRKDLALRLGNPQLLKIGLHTFRHWKAKKLYHETRSESAVKQFLRHKNLNTTSLYIQLDEALFQDNSDGFLVKATSDPKEIQALLEVGFEYVCQKDDLMYFRKRK